MVRVLLIFTPLMVAMFACSEGTNDSSVDRSENTPREDDTIQVIADSTDLETEDDGDSTESITAFIKRFVLNYEPTAKSIASFTHPEMGIYVMENPGAFHAIRYTEDFTFIEMNDWEQGFDCLPEHAPIPTFSCDKNEWSMDGCFYYVEDAPLIVPMMENMLKYDLAEDYNRERAQLTDELIEYELRNTKAFAGAYFGQVDGKWYLLALDLIVPCSA